MGLNLIYNAMGQISVSLLSTVNYQLPNFLLLKAYWPSNLVLQIFFKIMIINQVNWMRHYLSNICYQLSGQQTRLSAVISAVNCQLPTAVILFYVECVVIWGGLGCNVGGFGSSVNVLIEGSGKAGLCPWENVGINQKTTTKYWWETA